MSTLTTERLELRPISEADFEDHARITADPVVMQYIHDGSLDRSGAWWNIARYVGHWQLRGYGMWAVVERESTRVIGHMGFLNPEGGRGLELGWALEQSAWGRGYALEGARAAVEYGFSTMHAELIRCVIRGENVRSIRLAERLGARLESEFVEANGRYLVYGLERPKPDPGAGRPPKA